ncbi:MAG: Gfo/Idh/MocA family oxidoreductase [Candidatus Riflebacteria bacterium]|nr:Gfo/Idh/MocA family oxidoreductase [Candidatus Riflebacteria bacterium]
MEKVRIGVVGVGHLGQHHARLVADIEGATLQAVVDVDFERATLIAGRTGSRAYSSCEEILGQVDAVTVAAPTITHCQIARLFLEHGKDVLIEKPIASSIREAEELVKLAAVRNRILAVGHTERYNAAVMKLDELSRRPYYIESQRLAPFSARSTDIDVVLDLMIHDLDVILSIVGDAPVREVRAVGHPVLTSSIDMASAWIEFANGCVANVTASRVSREKIRKLRIFQDESYISLDYATQELHVWKRIFPDGQQAAPQLVEEKLDLTKVEPLKVELEEFVQAVRQRTEPRVTGRQGLAALQLAQVISDAIQPRIRASNMIIPRPLANGSIPS